MDNEPSPVVRVPPGLVWMALPRGMRMAGEDVQHVAATSLIETGSTRRNAGLGFYPRQRTPGGRSQAGLDSTVKTLSIA